MKKILISLTAAALMLLMCVYLASPALAAGTAPIAENLEIKTYRNVSVGGKMSTYEYIKGKGGKHSWKYYFWLQFLNWK